MKYENAKPILFNTEMVKAILNGQKTQTRRPIKPQPEKGMKSIVTKQDIKGQWWFQDDNNYECFPKCFCMRNDILYVRETFADIPETSPGNIHYRASATKADLKWFKENGWNWKPSIHMPKKLARIFLKVTDVSVERLQEISNKDIRSEGVCDWGCTCHRAIFKKSWDEIYKKRGYGWDKNPWVWIVEFKKIGGENK